MASAIRNIYGNLKKRSFLLLLVPGMGLYFTFIVYPLIAGLRYSLYNWDGIGPLTNFVGFENFRYILTSGDFSPFVMRALKHNMFIFGLSLVLQIALGLLVAYLLTRTKWVRFYQTTYFIPYTLSAVVVGFLWGLLLQPQWGIINKVLANVGLARSWLGSTSLALPTIVVISTWHGIAFPIMVFNAAMIGIPSELFEAARVDGASYWQILMRIVLPLILSTAILLSMLIFVGSFGVFGLIFVMQGAEAGPYYSTDVLGTLFYRTAFGGMGATARGMGLASALAVLNAFIVAPFSLVLVRLQRRFNYDL